MQCVYIKKDGNQCRARAVSNSDLCFSHEPALESAKLKAVTKGGLARKSYLKFEEPIKIETISDLKDVLASTIEGVWVGEIPANQPANTIGFLCRCYLDIHDKIELESRITLLEEKVVGMVGKSK